MTVSAFLLLYLAVIPLSLTLLADGSISPAKRRLLFEAIAGKRRIPLLGYWALTTRSLLEGFARPGSAGSRLSSLRVFLVTLLHFLLLGLAGLFTQPIRDVSQITIALLVERLPVPLAVFLSVFTTAWVAAYMKRRFLLDKDFRIRRGFLAGLILDTLAFTAYLFIAVPAFSGMAELVFDGAGAGFGAIMFFSIVFGYVFLQAPLGLALLLGLTGLILNLVFLRLDSPIRGAAAHRLAPMPMTGLWLLLAVPIALGVVIRCVIGQT